MTVDQEPVPSDDAIADQLRDAFTRRIAAEPAASIGWAAVLTRARRLVLVRRLAAVSACVIIVLGGSAIAWASTRSGARRGVTIVNPPSTTARTTTPTRAATNAVCTHQRTAFTQDSYYGLSAPKGPSIDFESSQLVPANDAHGNTIRIAALSVEKSGPDGTVILTSSRAGASVVLRGFGDFDGDGRTDLLVDVFVGGVNTTYIVPGTVAPGTHDPAAVGIVVPQPHYKAGEFAPFAAAVGDQNHDGADDVSFGARVYSGRRLAAGGAALPPPFRTLAAPYVGLLQLDAGGPPTFVEPDRDGSALDVLDGRSDRLDLGTLPTDVATAIANGARATGWLVNGHHIVDFSYSTRDGGTEWRWDLDGPCGP